MVWWEQHVIVADCSNYVLSNVRVWFLWSGESEKKIKTLFEQAKKSAPCVIFFDEIDRYHFVPQLIHRAMLTYRVPLSFYSLGGSREKNEDSSTKKVLTELLIQMSNIRPQEQITIVGATNRLWVVLTANLLLVKNCVPAFSAPTFLLSPKPHLRWSQIRLKSLNLFMNLHRCDLDTALLRRFERRIEGEAAHGVSI